MCKYAAGNTVDQCCMVLTSEISCPPSSPDAINFADIECESVILLFKRLDPSRVGPIAQQLEDIAHGYLRDLII